MTLLLRYAQTASCRCMQARRRRKIPVREKEPISPPGKFAPFIGRTLSCRNPPAPATVSYNYIFCSVFTKNCRHAVQINGFVFLASKVASSVHFLFYFDVRVFLGCRLEPLTILRFVPLRLIFFLMEKLFLIRAEKISSTSATKSIPSSHVNLFALVLKIC